MLNFNFQAPTKILFGENMIEQIGKEITKYGKKVLLVYGGGSIKKIGVYDTIIQLFQKNEIEYVELSGIQPNPRIEKVREGVQLCRENDIAFILAVGGGSVIDSSKAIAAGVFYDKDPWDFCMRRAEVKKALPIGTVLSLSATGSEMNGNAVISNEKENEKRGMYSSLVIPKFSVLDPTYTFSVSKYQTAAGTIDIMSHVLEQYFSPTENAYLQDRMAEAILKTCIHYGPIAVEDLNNYEARANLMWASSLALNGLLSTGKEGDWATHQMEHQASAECDVTHGVGLAIITPHWMEYVLDEKTIEKFVAYGRNVWGITGENDRDIAHQAIQKTKQFFASLEIPMTLKEVGIKEESLKEMAKRCVLFGEIGAFKKLDEQAILQIYQGAY